MPAKTDKQTQSGLPTNTAAAVSYVLGPITGILFLLMEKDSFVKYHAMQSIVFFVAVLVVNTALTITVVFAFLVPLLTIGEFAVWLMLIYKASQGEKWSLPVVGQFTDKLLSK